MIELTRGDIVQVQAEALVNTVNCVGVMGRGIALRFRKAFPENFRTYVAACRRGEVQPGRMVVHDMHTLHPPRYIINFPTKRHWKGKSRIEDIRVGLLALVDEIRSRDIRTVALPPLGCGLGGLDWDEVRPLIERAFESLPEVRVLVFEPAGAPATDGLMQPSEAPTMTVGRATLLGLMERYLAGVMDPHVTLLEIHKLMYFMQESGENLRLRYSKGIYGPYAENLRHVLQRIEGHFISGYADPEDRPDKQIELKEGVARHAESFLRDHPQTQQRFDRVVDLIRGFETPFGMELLATVHWVTKRDGAKTPDEVLAATYGWNDRKKMFKPSQIRTAWRVLCDRGWLVAGSQPGPTPSGDAGPTAHSGP